MCGYGFHVATRRGVGNITPPHGVLGMESVEKGKVQEISISKVFGDLDAMSEEHRADGAGGCLDSRLRA